MESTKKKRTRRRNQKKSTRESEGVANGSVGQKMFKKEGGIESL